MSGLQVLVTGGTGVLGREVMGRLSSASVEARALSRSGREGAIRGDLLTGEGLEEAVRDVNTIIHCASSPFHKSRQVDVEGTRRLLQVAAREGVSHVVYISIVGMEHAPAYPYYRIKLDTERVIESSPVPYTILRATQFHDLILKAIQFLGRSPVMLVPKGFLGQPIDAGEVAERLVEIALSKPAGWAQDVGGPEVTTLSDAARDYLKIAGRRKRILEVPFPGKTARAFREGALICPENIYGRITWKEFLQKKFGLKTVQIPSAHGRNLGRE